MKGLIGKKIGMTQVFRPDGKIVPCTVVELGPCVITQIKTEETDGYNSVQLAFGDQKESRVPNPLLGHFKKSNTSPKRKLVEIRDFDLEKELGDEINAEIFEEGERVQISGISKGKGFQGVVKRHGFHGVGMRTHGQHNRERAPGSLGPGSTPSRVFKGMKMAGRTGNDQVTLKKVRVEKVIAEKNLVFLKGSVPGAINGYVIVKS